MKAKIYKMIVLVTGLILTITISKATNQDSLNNKISPLSADAFIKNVGQWDNQILYTGNSTVGEVKFTNRGLSFSSLKNKPIIPNLTFPEELINQRANCEILAWDLNFKSPSSNMKVINEGENKSIISYLYSTDNSKNFPNVPQTKSIVYTNVYNNIDFTYYMKEGGLKYDVRLKPNANANDIGLSYDGIKSLKIDNNGDLLVETPWFSYTEQKPYSYQIINGKKQEVKVEYVITGNNEFGFEIKGPYDKNIDLIIDPFFYSWSTYLRLTLWGYSRDIVLDNQQNVYECGWIKGPYMLSPGNYIYSGQQDGYIAKFNSAGVFQFFTIIGGVSNNDFAIGIDVDNAGNSYITGYTSSLDYPHNLSGFGFAYSGQGDAFLTTLNSAGNSITNSVFIGGNDNDFGMAVTVDPITNNAFVTGYTYSNSFPLTIGVVQTLINGVSDAFISCIGPTGNLIASTYFGGNMQDISMAIKRDGFGNICIAGYTDSPIIQTTPGVYQNTIGGDFDGLVAKFNPSLTMLIKSTYIGGSRHDLFFDLDINPANEIFLVGFNTDQNSTSNHYPTTPGVLFQTPPGGDQEAIVTRLSNDFSTLIYSTYLGGADEDIGWGISVNNNNEAFVTGQTNSIDFPLQNQLSSNPWNGSFDLFISHISADGTRFECGGSSVIGGDDNDYYSVRNDINSITNTTEIVLNGTSHSGNFPTTPGAYQTSNLSPFFQSYDDEPILTMLNLNCDPLGDPRLIIGDITYDDTPCAGSCITISAPILSGYSTPANFYSTDPNLTISYSNGSTLEMRLCFDQNITGNYTLYLFQNQNIGNYPPIMLQFNVLPAPASFNLGPDQVLCPGNSITLSTSPVTGLNYMWNTGASSSHININTAGTFSLTATNSYGCTAGDEVTITTLQSYLQNVATCKGQSVQLDAGPQGVSYSWSPSAGLNNPNIQNPLATVSQTTTYTVTVTYTNGCTNTGSVTVTVPVYSIGAPLTVCKGSCIKLSAPDELCVKSATWFYTSNDPHHQGTDIPLGSGNSICISPTSTGNYCVRIITCGGCEILICRTITVVSEKDCRNLPVINDNCCISSERQLSSVEEIKDLYVYPNPADKSIVIKLTSVHENPADLSIYDALGRLVLKSKLNENNTYEQKIDLTNWQQGIYYLMLISENDIKTGKFVKE